MVGIVAVACLGVVAFIMSQSEAAIACVGIIGGFLGTGVAIKKSSTSTEDTTQATSEEQETPITTDELAAQVNNMDDSGSAAVNTDNTNKDSQANSQATTTAPIQITLSDASVQALAAAINTQNQQNTGNPQTPQ